MIFTQSSSYFNLFFTVTVLVWRRMFSLRSFYTAIIFSLLLCFISLFKIAIIYSDCNSVFCSLFFIVLMWIIIFFICLIEDFAVIMLFCIFFTFCITISAYIHIYYVSYSDSDWVYSYFCCLMISLLLTRCSVSIFILSVNIH